jgi:hypothetical protein
MQRFLAALTILFVVHLVAADWTYRDTYNYAVERGSPDDPVAISLREYINASPTLQWTDPYDGGVTFNGSVLTVADTAHGRAVLNRIENIKHKNRNWRLQNEPLGKRDIIEDSYATGYPYVDTCSDSVFYTWFDLDTGACYAYWNQQQLMRIYSLEVYGFSKMWFFRDTELCGENGKLTQGLPAWPVCLTSMETRGVLSFRPES